MCTIKSPNFAAFFDKIIFFSTFCEEIANFNRKYRGVRSACDTAESKLCGVASTAESKNSTSKNHFQTRAPRSQNYMTTYFL